VKDNFDLTIEDSIFNVFELLKYYSRKKNYILKYINLFLKIIKNIDINVKYDIKNLLNLFFS